MFWIHSAILEVVLWRKQTTIQCSTLLRDSVYLISMSHFNQKIKRDYLLGTKKLLTKASHTTELTLKAQNIETVSLGISTSIYALFACMTVLSESTRLIIVRDFLSSNI